jgi:hypothetical protein
MEVEGSSNGGSYANFEETNKIVKDLEQHYTDVHPEVDIVDFEKNTSFDSTKNTEVNMMDKSEKTINYIDIDNHNKEINKIIINDNSYEGYFQKMLGKNWKVVMIFILIEMVFLGLVLYKLFFDSEEEMVPIPGSPTPLQVASLVSNFVN